MEYIFISPHLDDISLSCGGIVHNLSKKQNDIQIWTIFAGDPPKGVLPEFALSLHRRWSLTKNVVQNRREEDIISCNILGAKAVHFSYPDCIYRNFENGQPLIQNEEDLYQDISRNQENLVENISQMLNCKLNQDQIVVAPISIGNHIDHQIVRKAVNHFDYREMWFYADYPYNIKSSSGKDSKNIRKYKKINFNLDSDDINAWHKSIAAYKSQISTFWSSENLMINEIKKYALSGGGNNLWESFDYGS